MLEKQTPVEQTPLTIKDVDAPVPLSHQVLIRVSACGVCRTDLHIVEGDLPLRKVPIVVGHQIVGEVEAVGKEVRLFKLGQRVGVGWVGSVCGRCDFCRNGKENLCREAKFTGWDRDGGYAEYVVADERCTFSIPEGYDNLSAAPLLCGGVIGFRALKMTGITSGRLGLWGFGASAHIVCQIAVAMGFDVFVFSRGERHLKVAKQLGASWCGRPTDRPPAPLLASIIFAPAGELIPLALSHLDRAGTLVLAGIHMTKTPPLDYRLLYWERSIRTVANFTREDAEELLKAAVKHRVRTRFSVFPLEEANRALFCLKHGQLEAAAVIKIR